MIHHDTTFVSFKLFTVAKKPLVKLTLTAALIGAAAIQTACSATTLGSESPSMPASETPETANASPHPSTSMSAVKNASKASDDAADDSGSVIPPLGSFDRRDPDFVQYKPCLEMPDEFLAQAGLYSKEMLEGVGEVDGVCAFPAKPEHGEAVYKLVGSSFDFEAYERIPGEVAWDETREGVPVLLHRGEHLEDSSCRALIETQRGTFGTVFQSFEYGNESYQYDHCKEASSLLKTILEMELDNEN